MIVQDPFDKSSPFTALERARRERLTAAIGSAVAMGAVMGTVLYILMLAISPSSQLALAVVLTATHIPGGLLTRHLARRGKADLGGYIVLIHLLFDIGLVALLIEGLAPVIAPGYITLVVMAGMMLGATGSYVIATGAAMLWFCTLVVTERGLLMPGPLPSFLPSVPLTGITVLAFYFVAHISRLAIRDLRRALDDATYDLIQVNRELDRTSRLKTSFLARMSHDLRTPLSAIRLSADLMLRQVYGPLTPKQEGTLDRILRSAGRLKALIDDILDLAKIEAGQLELTAEAFQIGSLVDEVRTSLAQRAQDKGLQFSASIAPDMPPQIVGDENRLAQIIFNLADNALKFTEQGEVAIKIEPKNDDHWHLIVRDTGRGIHERDFETIFEEFHQTDSAISAASGTGLGLAIVRYLVQMMGGEIHLSSQIGKGSTFKVTLPLIVPET